MITSQSTHTRNAPKAVRKTLVPVTSYLRVKIEGIDSKTDEFGFQAILFTATKNMFGLSGMAATACDILDWNPASSEGIISCQYDATVAVRGALTLCHSLDSKPIQIRIIDVSTELSGLAVTQQWDRDL